MSAKSTIDSTTRSTGIPWRSFGKMAGVLGMVLTSFAGGAVYQTPQAPPAEAATLPPAKFLQMAEDVASIKRDLELLREDVKDLRDKQGHGKGD